MTQSLKIGNGITAHYFATSMDESQIDDKELGFTYAGRRILKKILQVPCYYLSTS